MFLRCKENTLNQKVTEQLSQEPIMITFYFFSKTKTSVTSSCATVVPRGNDSQPEPLLSSEYQISMLCVNEDIIQTDCLCLESSSQSQESDPTYNWHSFCFTSHGCQYKCIAQQSYQSFSKRTCTISEERKYVQKIWTSAHELHLTL